MSGRARNRSGRRRIPKCPDNGCEDTRPLRYATFRAPRAAAPPGTRRGKHRGRARSCGPARGNARSPRPAARSTRLRAPRPGAPPSRKARGVLHVRRRSRRHRHRGAEGKLPSQIPPGAGIEVFFADRTMETFGRCGAGWFWWPRRRGYAPAGPAAGPFPTSYAAYRHAMNIPAVPSSA